MGLYAGSLEPSPPETRGFSNLSGLGPGYCTAGGSHGQSAASFQTEMLPNFKLRVPQAAKPGLKVGYDLSTKWAICR